MSDKDLGYAILLYEEKEAALINVSRLYEQAEQSLNAFHV